MSKQTLKHGLMAVVFALCCITSAWSADTSEYDTAAKSFLSLSGSTKEITSAKMLESKTSPGTPIGYLVNLKGGGYILLSVSKNQTPVKAYSFTSDFNKLPASFKESVLEQLEKNATAAVVENSEAKAQWDMLLNPDSVKVSRAATVPVQGPFLWTNWDQGFPYNKYIPNNALVGGTNVALAQIMKNLQAPPSPNGAVKWMDRTIVFGGKSYNWDDTNMPPSFDPSVNPAITPSQIDQIAVLMRDIAYANYTNFGEFGSSAWININAMVENFGYSAAIDFMQNSKTDYAAFMDMLTEEMNNFRPVLFFFLGSQGHAAVADGYQKSFMGQLQIHFNLGWGGGSYYTIEPTDSVLFYYNLMPCDADIPADPDADPPVLAEIKNDCAYHATPKQITMNGVAVDHFYLEAEDTMSVLYNGYRISGKFNLRDDGVGINDIDRYENVLLTGNTTFTITSPYSGQDYFVSLYDADGGIVSKFPMAVTASSVKKLTTALPPGRYSIKFSLCKDTLDASGPCRPADNMGTLYTMSVTTGTMTLAQKNQLRLSNRPPVINTPFKTIVVPAGTYTFLVDAGDPDGDLLTITGTGTTTPGTGTTCTGNICTVTVGMNADVLATFTITDNKITTPLNVSFVVIGVNPAVFSIPDPIDPDNPPITTLPLGYLPFGKSFHIWGDLTASPMQSMLLDGACSIKPYSYTLYRTTENPFYISLDDADGVIAENTKEIDSADFPAGRYELTTTTDPEINYTGSQYYAKVDCPGATDSVQDIEALLGFTSSCMPTTAPIIKPTISQIGQALRVTWDKETGLAYRLYRNSTEVYYGTNGTYDDKPPSGTHSYTLKSENLCGLSPASAAVSGTFSATTCSTTPAVPRGLRAAIRSQTSLRMTWYAVSGTGMTYKLHRATSSTGTYTQIYPSSTTPVATANSFTDTGLTRGKRYYYKIQSVNACGTASALSSAAAAITLP